MWQPPPPDLLAGSRSAPGICRVKRYASRPLALQISCRIVLTMRTWEGVRGEGGKGKGGAQQACFSTMRMTMGRGDKCKKEVGAGGQV